MRHTADSMEVQPVLLGVAAVSVVMFLLRARIRAFIYDKVISNNLTTSWYKAVLSDLSPNSTLLDVGIGTAGALCNNATLLHKKDIKVVGIDYDNDYIVKANQSAANAGLSERLHSLHMSVYDTPLPAPPGGGELYDAVYFSGSIVLMPDPAEALKAVAKSLKPGGLIYVTQTFQIKAWPLLKFTKPMMRYITSIDFGKLTFEKDILDIVKQAGMEVKEYRKIEDSVQTAYQTARFLAIKAN